VTGELRLTCPLVHWVQPPAAPADAAPRRRGAADADAPATLGPQGRPGGRGGPGGVGAGGLRGAVDIRAMARGSPAAAAAADLKVAAAPAAATATAEDDDFVDDPDCPPLE
jgi:hypothetical protein